MYLNWATTKLTGSDHEAPLWSCSPNSLWILKAQSLSLHDAHWEHSWSFEGNQKALGRPQNPFPFLYAQNKKPQRRHCAKRVNFSCWHFFFQGGYSHGLWFSTLITRVVCFITDLWRDNGQPQSSGATTKPRSDLEAPCVTNSGNHKAPEWSQSSMWC